MIWWCQFCALFDAFSHAKSNVCNIFIITIILLIIIRRLASTTTDRCHAVHHFVGCTVVDILINYSIIQCDCIA